MNKKWLVGIFVVAVAAQVSVLKQGNSNGGSVALVFKTPHPELWALLPVDTGTFACARKDSPGLVCEDSLAFAVLGKGLALYRWGS